MLEAIEDGAFIQEVVDQFFSFYAFEQQDKAFINRILYGTVENKFKLDYILNQFSKVTTSKMKKTVLILLRMSVYQLLYMDSVPDSAVIDEAVKLIKKRKMVNLSGFINGLLRTISREKNNISFPTEKNLDYLSIIYSFPKWLLELLVEQYDFETVEAICENSLRTAPLCVRHNPLRGNESKLLALLHKDKIAFEKGHLLPYAYYLDGVTSLKQSIAFKEGLFQVQDESSMLIGEVAKPRETDFVLDLCAAPGGKTTHLAALMRNKGQILARDVSDKKLQLIQENLTRLGITNVKLTQHDATILDPALVNQCDLVLSDVPCSGLGILQRKPDIKYNVTEKGLESLLVLQQNILRTASSYVKVGGALVYSTCTINQRENEAQVHLFLKEHPQFEIVPLEIELPNLHITEQNKGFLQLLPIGNVTDGFFIAKLRRMA